MSPYVFGLDNILPSDSTSVPVALSSYSKKAVVASPHGGAWIEDTGDAYIEPLQIMDGDFDNVAFFGRNKEMIALTSGDALYIINEYDLRLQLATTIMPNSLYAAPKGDSPVIGVRSPSGAVVTIDEYGNVTPTGKNMRPHEVPIWSPSVLLVGKMWSSDDHVYLQMDDADSATSPATASSEYGIDLRAIWGNPLLKRYEAYITTHDAPALLKRFSAHHGTSTFDVVINTKNHPIHDVINNTAGRPLVAVSRHDGITTTHLLSPGNDVAHSAQSLYEGQSKYRDISVSGTGHFLSYTQTPVTPRIAEVIPYAHRDVQCRDIVKARTRTRSEYVVPKTNTVLYAENRHGKKYPYRVVSRTNLQYHKYPIAAVLIDRDGSVSAGGYSPTVEMLYSMGIPSIIIPRNRTMSDNDCADALCAVADSAVNIKKFAAALTVIATTDDAISVCLALARKRSALRNAMIIDPPSNIDALLNSKNKHKVTLYKSSELGAEGVESIKKTIKYYISA